RDRQLARRGREDAPDDGQQRGLARPRRPLECDDLAGSDVQRNPAKYFDPLRPLLERLANVLYSQCPVTHVSFSVSLCLCGLGFRCSRCYPRKTSAGSMRDTRRNANTAAPRHMSTVPANTVAPNCGVSSTVRWMRPISGRAAHDAAAPSTKP